MEGVLGSGSAKYFSAGVGTVMNVRVGTHVYDVKIVGIVKQAKATPGVIMGPGGMSGPAFSSLFVPVKVCEKITGQPFAPNLIYVQLKEGVDKKEFAETFPAGAGTGFRCSGEYGFHHPAAFQRPVRLFTEG